MQKQTSPRVSVTGDFVPETESSGYKNEAFGSRSYSTYSGKMPYGGLTSKAPQCGKVAAWKQHVSQAPVRAGL